MTISHTLAMQCITDVGHIWAVLESPRRIRLKPDYQQRSAILTIERSGAPAEAMQVYSQGLSPSVIMATCTLKEMQVFLKRLEQVQGRET